MKRRTFLLTTGSLAAIALVYSLLPAESVVKQSQFWQEMTSPGPLSKAHESLSCNDCHTAVAGAELTRCVACHANNELLLNRQPTSFHAHVDSCQECHREHQGRDHRPSEMDHKVFAKLAHRSLTSSNSSPEAQGLSLAIADWNERAVSPHKSITPQEAILDCASCHSKDDRHFGLFGQNCQQCHATVSWTLPDYKHPSPRSTDCNQCHQAPPSHYMGHFKMISATVAVKPKARVDQCYECHETNSWNDIVGVGWYKHH